MQRAVSSLPLSGSWLAKLASCGYETVDDLRRAGVAELCRELGVSNSEALEIIRVAKRTSRSPSPQLTPHAHPPRSTSGLSQLAGCSALELLQREQAEGSIVTFCAAIDEMLGGGVALGKLTEFCGAPGLGKTQLSIQLAVDVSIPEPLGGLGGEAVYIDTEGSFIIERVAEIAKAAVRHLKTSQSSEDKAVAEAARRLSLETVLSSIHLFRCHDYLELVATVNVLSDFLFTHPQVRLAVIDSIAAHFRHGFPDMSKRNRLLGALSQSLLRLATSHRLAVVLTNQMTTKVLRGQQNTAQLVPALGESWGHASTVRVVLSWSGSERAATLHKSPTHRQATVPFAITADGIRDSHLSDGTSSTPVPASQCLPVPEEDFEDEQALPATDEMLVNMTEPAMWQGGVGQRSRVEENDMPRHDDNDDDVQISSDFVSVSSFHEANFDVGEERRRRKRPHPSDPEL